MIVIGVDTGGTFTDFVFKKGGQWGIFKILSTPSNPAIAVLKGLEEVAGRETKRIIHGSTVATNAILERKGAKTALITNKGFEDIIEIGRQNRERLYDLGYQKEPHIVPPELRFGIKGRVLRTGEELEPVLMRDIKAAATRLREWDVESVAVCFLFSFLNPDHEKSVGKALEPLGIPMSLSHQILSEFREYERCSTTVINAYVSPKMKNYISFLMERLKEEDTLSIMQSNGGSISAGTAMRESVRTILSGPAGGVVGACEIGRTAGFDKLITFDMGGTSTDVSLVDGQMSITTEATISGYPLKVPMIHIHTVGAGGGSIAYLDQGGSLRVGPESAGADPGPICYGKGEQITVTDANLYLGRLIAQYFLGGNMVLETERIERFFKAMASQADLSPVELAEGILAVANTAMEKAIRVISVERGYDPREFTLFSFGGAGGMHAAFLARLLNIPKVLIPRDPGILSAIGMLMADVIKDYSQTVMRLERDLDPGELQKLFAGLEARGMEELRLEGIGEESVVLERYLDMRYQGQSYEIIVPFEGDFVERFHSLHEKTYGYRNQDKMVEVVNIRLRARGIPEKPKLEEVERGKGQPTKDALLEERNVVFDGKEVVTKIFMRDRLKAGNQIQGPAVVVEYSSTIVIPPFAKGEVDSFGNLLLQVQNS